MDYLKTMECLRVRRRGDEFAEITYKPASTDTTHSAAGAISKQETNVGLANAGLASDAEALLELIGMVPLARVDKARTSWRHPDLSEVTVAVDEVQGAGTFVEVEVISDDPGEAEQVLARVEEDLGLNGHPVVAMPYRDLVRATELGRLPGH
ncbi:MULTISPECIES: CYTH domain-containing protein [unclassified Nocardiopsis]|uniref:CYTH domain-containing protein n=1 Tax=Nocardiopsis TaxID=2013 RepID=UPI00387B51B5